MAITLWISFLHSHNLMHQDLEPSTWLCDTTRQWENTMLPTIKKFSSKLWTSVCPNTFRSRPTMRLACPCGKCLEFCKGKILRPIKRTNHEDQSCKMQASNVYSLGMVYCEVVTGRCPFKEDMNLGPFRNLHGQIKARERPHLPKGLISNLVDMIKRCW